MFQYIGIIPADLPLDEINDIVGYQDVFVKANDNKEFFGLEINGNSMYPDFKDKDHVSSSNSLIVTVGKIVLL